MKTKLLLIFFLLGVFRLLAEDLHIKANQEELASTANHQITAGAYCEFLNAVAAEDPNHFYDEKMSLDLGGACILRSGAPGSYYYSVIEGKENAPVVFVGTSKIISYLEWLQNDELVLTGMDNTSAPFLNNDQELLSNKINFCLTNNQSIRECSGEGAAASWQEFIEEATFIAGLVGAGESHSRQRELLPRGTRIPIDNSEELSSGESSEEENFEFSYGVLHQRIDSAQREKERLLEEVVQFSTLSFDEQEELKDETRCTSDYWKEQKDWFCNLLKSNVDGEKKELMENVMKACEEAEETANRLVAMGAMQQTEVASQIASALLPHNGKEMNNQQLVTTFTAAEQEKVSQAIKQFAMRNDLEKAQYRQAVDNHVKQYQQGWEHHSATRQQHHESKQAFKKAGEKLEQTKKDNSEERLPEKPLGQAASLTKKVAQVASIAGKVTSTVGGVLATIPPLAPLGIPVMGIGKVMSIGGEEASKGVEVLEEMNQRAAEYEIHKESVRCNQAEEKEAEAQGRVEKAHHIISSVTKKVEQNEASLLTKERKTTAVRAQQLRPKHGWGEHQWQHWMKSMLAMVAHDNTNLEEESALLSARCRSSCSWIIERTAAAWQQRLDQSRLRLRQLERKGKKRLSRLEKVREQLLEKVERLKEECNALPGHEKEDQLQQEVLEKQITAYDEEENLYQPTPIREHYLENLESLTKIKERLAQFPKTKVTLESQIREIIGQEQAALARLTQAQKKYQVRWSLAKTSLESDREQLRKWWPEYDLTFRPYLEWELPFASEVKPAALPPIEESEKVSIIDPPLKLEEEREAQGRVYFYQARKAIEEAVNSTFTIVKEQVFPSTEPAPSLYEALLTWSLEQVLDPAAAEQERWKIRWKLDGWRHKSDQLTQSLVEVAKEEPMEERSVSSWVPSIRTFSRFSFSATQPSSVMEAALESAAKDLVEQWEAARSKVNELEKQWLDLVVKAEQARGSDKQDQVEDDTNLDDSIIDAWANADRQAGQKYRRSQRLYGEKQEAEKRYARWMQDNKRWQARADLDRAKKELGDLKKNEQQRYKALPKRLKESQRLAEKKKIQGEFEGPLTQAREKVNAAEKEWRKLAEQKIASSLALQGQESGIGIHTVEEVETFDKAALERWNQLQQKLNLEGSEASTLEKQWDEDLEKNESEEPNHLSGLDNLEKLWESILTATQEEEFIKAQEAALQYHEGDETFWKENLTEQERQRYNNQIQQKNILYKKDLAREERHLEELQQQLQKEQKKAKKFSVRFIATITGQQQRTLAFLKETQSYYDERKEEWIRKNESLRLEAMTPLEREQYIQEQIKLKKEEKINQWIASLPELAKQIKRRAQQAERVPEIQNHNSYYQSLADTYQKAIKAQLSGNREAVENYYQSAQAYEAATEALAIGDEGAAKLHEKRAEILRGNYSNPGAAFMYEKAAETGLTELTEFIRNGSRTTEQYRKSAQTYKAAEEAYHQQIGALARGDKAAVELHEKRAIMLGGNDKNPGAAFMRGKAAEAESKGNHKATKEYRKSAEAYEAAAEALVRGDTIVVELHEKRAIMLGGNEFNPGAAYMYEKAARAESAGDRELAEHYRKSAKAYEAVAETYHQKINALTRGGIIVAEINFLRGYKAAECYHKSAQAYEAAAEALTRGDAVAVGFYKKRAAIFGGSYSNPGAAFMYERAAQAESKRNGKAVEQYRKSAEAFEAVAEALVKGDAAAAELQEKKAKSLGGDYHNPGAVSMYEKAAEAKSQGNGKAAEQYYKSAEAYEAVAEALVRGDAAAAELHEKKAKSLGGDYHNPGAAFMYKRAAEAEFKRNGKAVELYRKSAEAYEAVAEALVRGDAAAVELHEKRAILLVGNHNYPGAAYMYEKAAAAESIGNREAVENYRKSAQAYEAAVEDLVRGDAAAAKLQEKKAKIFGSRYFNPRAASMYERAAEAESKRNGKAAEQYCKSAEAYEAVAEALVKKNEAAAELQEKIAKILGGNLLTSGAVSMYVTSGAAFMYERAAEAESRGDREAAENYRKQAEAYEEQAEALSKQLEAAVVPDKK